MSSMWTYASRWCMSARVYGAELELSSSSVVPVQRMSMEWAVAGTAMAALDSRARDSGFELLNLTPFNLTVNSVNFTVKLKRPFNL